jgi:ectoine hydroxylase-related dioxygenase (phytanoyl-CoA dioxygenase family)
MNAREKYFWDLTGYLVVRQVLTSDEIAEANEAIDGYSRQLIEQGVDAEVQGKEQVFGGVVVRTTNAYPHFLRIEERLSDPFTKMLIHPRIVSHLNEMCGKGFRLDHGPELIAHTKGVKGLRLHGSGNRHKPYVAYHHQNGMHRCGGVTVSWQFANAKLGDGGFGYVTGSHKSNYNMSEDLQYLRDHDFAVRQAEVQAGDVLFFMDGAQTHGTFPWQAAHQRRSVLYKYTTRSSTRSGQAEVLAPPDNYWDEPVMDGMTAEQKAVMWGPYSNYHEELPHLDVEGNGEVKAVTCTDPGDIWSDNRG